MSGDSRARLFVALELPGPARDALAKWRSELPAPVTRALRPVAAEALHVTLCFLGWRAEDEVEAIAAACRVVAPNPAPWLAFEEALWLPRRRPRVMAVKLADADERLTRGQAALSDALVAGRWYRREKRPFLPHVTVGRVKSGPGPSHGVIPAPPRLGFTASRVVLYRSRLARTGARYEALSTVEFAD